MKLHHKLAIGIIMASSLVSCVGHQDQENLSTKNPVIIKSLTSVIPNSVIKSGEVNISDEELYQLAKNEAIKKTYISIDANASCYDKQGYLLGNITGSALIRAGDFYKDITLGNIIGDANNQMQEFFDKTFGKIYIFRNDNRFYLGIVQNRNMKNIGYCGFDSDPNNNVIDTNFLINLFKLNKQSGATVIH
jgi:hypothetical protein